MSLLIAFLANAQKVFFCSSQTLTEKQLENLYTSLNLNDNLVVFNASDYILYAYDKNSGEQKWQYELKRKSSRPPFFAGGFIWAVNGDKQVIKLDPTNGAMLMSISNFTMETQPFLKNNILYFTGIYEGGCLIAYDLQTNAVLWKRFLAHGYSKTPYFLADKIVANAEGDNWLEINYDGSLKETDCDKDAVEGDFPSGLPCAKQFLALTHDGKEIKGKLAEDFLLNGDHAPEISTTAKHSFILNEGQLFILGNKLKTKSSLLLSSLFNDLEEDYDALEKILQADEQTITLLYSHQLIIFNHREKKLVKSIDLSSWEPHQAIIDTNKLWLISRKDGLLYGLVID